MSKGICFTEEMFNAVIDGRKTQTRRIMKPQPQTFYNNIPFYSTGRTFEEGTIIAEIKPRYKAGEIVYLKEPYLPIMRTIYKYDGGDCDPKLKWKNKLFMPARYARYFIEITAVRCKRLRNISDGDCELEGIFPVCDNTWIVGWSNKSDGKIYESRKQAYAALINKINGKGTWECNPFVWVYDFKLTDKPTNNE